MPANATNVLLDQNQFVDVPKVSTDNPGNVSHAHSAGDKTTTPNNVLKLPHA
jgi:hypothetical protein